MKLYPDPHLKLSDPYAHLSRRLAELGKAGVGPDSSSREINEVFFDLMVGGSLSAADRQAWDSLRQSRERMLRDFCLYRLDPDDTALSNEAMFEFAMPVQWPDFLQLADFPPNYSDALRLSHPVALDEQRGDGVVDIDPEMLQWAELEIDVALPDEPGGEKEDA